MNVELTADELSTIIDALEEIADNFEDDWNEESGEDAINTAEELLKHRKLIHRLVHLTDEKAETIEIVAKQISNIEEWLKEHPR